MFCLVWKLSTSLPALNDLLCDGYWCWQKVCCVAETIWIANSLFDEFPRSRHDSVLQQFLLEMCLKTIPHLYLIIYHSFKSQGKREGSYHFLYWIKETDWERSHWILNRLQAPNYSVYLQSSLCRGGAKPCISPHLFLMCFCLPGRLTWPIQCLPL